MTSMPIYSATSCAGSARSWAGIDVLKEESLKPKESTPVTVNGANRLVHNSRSWVGVKYILGGRGSLGGFVGFLKHPGFY